MFAFLQIRFLCGAGFNVQGLDQQNWNPAQPTKYGDGDVKAEKDDWGKILLRYFSWRFLMEERRAGIL